MSERVLGRPPYVIVCSYGPLGRAVVAEIRRMGAPFAVVESGADDVRELRKEGIPHVVGSSTRESVLRRVGVGDATAIVCTASSVIENARTVELVRRIGGDVYIVARADETERGRELLLRVGADKVLSPAIETGRHMVALARYLESVDAPRSGSER